MLLILGLVGCRSLADSSTSLARDGDQEESYDACQAIETFIPHGGTKDVTGALLPEAALARRAKSVLQKPSSIAS